MIPTSYESPELRTLSYSEDRQRTRPRTSTTPDRVHRRARNVHLNHRLHGAQEVPMLRGLTYEELMDMSHEVEDLSQQVYLLEINIDIFNFFQSKSMLLADPLKETAIPEGWSLQERLCVFEFQTHISLTAMPTLLYSKLLTSKLS